MSKIFFLSMCDVKVSDIYFTEYGTALTTVLPILCLYLNTVIVNRNESGMFGALQSDSTHHFFRNAYGYQVRVITVFTVFRLLTDFVCLYTYEFWLSLCKIVRSSVILLLPLFRSIDRASFYYYDIWFCNCSDSVIYIYIFSL